MAYTRQESYNFMEQAKVLLRDNAGSMDFVTLRDDALLVAIIANEADRTELLAARNKKDFALVSTGSTAATPAVGTFVIATDATGDGIVGLTIDGAQYDITPTAADTPTIMGDALAPIITAGGTHTAVNAAGTITITDVTPGTAGNAVVFVDVTADSTTTGTATSPAGGTDATQTGSISIIEGSAFAGSVKA